MGLLCNRGLCVTYHFRWIHCVHVNVVHVANLAGLRQRDQLEGHKETWLVEEPLAIRIGQIPDATQHNIAQSGLFQELSCRHGFNGTRALWVNLQNWHKCVKINRGVEKHSCILASRGRGRSGTLPVYSRPRRWGCACRTPCWSPNSSCLLSVFNCQFESNEEPRPRTRRCTCS